MFRDFRGAMPAANSERVARYGKLGGGTTLCGMAWMAPLAQSTMFVLHVMPGDEHHSMRDYFVENSKGDIAGAQYNVVVNVRVGHKHAKHRIHANYDLCDKGWEQ